MRDTRWLIAVGLLVGIIGAVVFIGVGNQHAACNGFLTLIDTSCTRVNDFYDGSIVAMAAGGLMLAAGIVTYRPGTQRVRRPTRKPGVGERVLIVLLGILLFVGVVALVFYFG